MKPLGWLGWAHVMDMVVELTACSSGAERLAGTVRRRRRRWRKNRKRNRKNGYIVMERRRKEM